MQQKRPTPAELSVPQTSRQGKAPRPKTTARSDAHCPTRSIDRTGCPANRALDERGAISLSPARPRAWSNHGGYAFALAVLLLVPSARAQQPAAAEPTQAPPLPAPDAAVPEPPAPAPDAAAQPPAALPAAPAARVAPTPTPRKHRSVTQTEQDAEPVKPPATLIDPKRLTLGGFGGLHVMYTRVLGTDSVLVGGEGALLLNHAFSVGVAGGGIANEINPTSQTRLDFGYGGVLLRYHFFSSEVVNFAVGAMVGAGGVSVHDRDINDEDVDWEKTGESMFVVEPELGLYLNVTRWLRLGAVGGYRFVSGVDKNELSNADVRGAIGGASLQLGWF